MTRQFDLIAIGTGSAGSGVTSRCREAGWKVAIVDSRPFGGTCALRGCDPKKVLVGAAEAVDWTRRMKGRGIQAADLQIDWPELMRFKRSFTETVSKRREDEFAKAGIAAFHGRARFAGPTTVQVGEETLEGRYVVIAAGEAPADLGIPGAEHLTTSLHFSQALIPGFSVEGGRSFCGGSVCLGLLLTVVCGLGCCVEGLKRVLPMVPPGRGVQQL
jgi:glutathione reductase (NADPH)